MYFKFIIKIGYESPTWVEVPMSNIFLKRFRVIHVSWDSWVNYNNQRNVWGAQFSDQWFNRRGVISPSINSDLGSFSRNRTQNSDYGSISQNVVNWLNLLYIENTINLKILYLTIFYYPKQRVFERKVSVKFEGKFTRQCILVVRREK